MYQCVTGALVVDALNFRNTLEGDLDQCPRLCCRLVQVAMQSGIVVIPVRALRAVDLERREVGNELSEMMGALAVDSRRSMRKGR